MRFLLWALCACLLLGTTSCGTQFTDTVRGWFGIDAPDWNPTNGNPQPVTMATVSGVVHEQDPLSGDFTTPLADVAVFILPAGQEANAARAVAQPGQAPIEGTVAYAYTDSTGHYSLTNVPYGDHQLFFAWQSSGAPAPQYVRQSVPITVSTPTYAVADDKDGLPQPGSGGGCGGNGGPMPASIRGLAYYPGGLAAVDHAAWYISYNLTDTGATASSDPTPRYPSDAVVTGTTSSSGCFLAQDLFDPAGLQHLTLLPPNTSRDVRVVIVKTDTLGHRWSKAVTMTLSDGQNYLFQGADPVSEIVQLTTGAGI